MRRAARMCVLAAMASNAVWAADGPVSLRFGEQWSNVSAGKEVAFHVTAVADEAFAGRIGWRFSVGGATLARGERAMAAEPGRDHTVAIRLQVPDVKKGVVMDTVLAVDAFDGRGRTRASIEKAIRIFPEDPFFQKKDWLKALNIYLFDPEKKTSRVFDDAGIPFLTVRNAESLSEGGEGLVVVGEGVSFADYRGLAGIVIEAAAGGRPVLWLAPDGGELTIPGMGESGFPAPASLVFRQADIIPELDKRLDYEAWPPDGNVTLNSVTIRGERGPVVGKALEGSDGWPWIEMNFDNGGRLIVCGFAIVGKWDVGPTPRYLLARMLEYLAEKGD